jgi:flavin-binding protein dodecin
MSVAKIIEVSAESPDSFEAAIGKGIETAQRSVRNIQGAWIKEHKVVVDDGKVSAYRVDMKVTFVLD